MSMTRIAFVLSFVCAACGETSSRAHVVDATAPVDAASPATDAGGDVTPASERAAAIAAKDLTLVGTLEVPARRRAQRFAAVVFGHGSGPQSRDETLDGQLGMRFGCTLGVFSDLARSLRDRGFASLRFDKRACGPFNQCAENGYPTPEGTDTVQTEIEDIRAAATWLAQQPEVDPGRVYYVGHSEGASFAPALLKDGSAFRAGVMLAAPYASADRLLAMQLAELRALLSKLGTGDASADQQLAPLEDAVRALAAVRAGKPGVSKILGGSPAYWQSWFAVTDDAPALASVTAQPLLVLSGDYDLNVPPSENAAWKNRFDADGKPEHRTELMPCVTHALNCIVQPEVTKIRKADIGCSVDTRIANAVADFLDSIP